MGSKGVYRAAFRMTWRCPNGHESLLHYHGPSTGIPVSMGCMTCGVGAAYADARVIQTINCRPKQKTTVSWDCGTAPSYMTEE